MNYIGNAMKFTSKGRIFVIAGFKKDSNDPNNGRLSIAVQDEGCGMSYEDKLKLF